LLLSPLFLFQKDSSFAVASLNLSHCLLSRSSSGALGQAFPLLKIQQDAFIHDCLFEGAGQAIVVDPVHASFRLDIANSTFVNSSARRGGERFVIMAVFSTLSGAVFVSRPPAFSLDRSVLGLVSTSFQNVHADVAGGVFYFDFPVFEVDVSISNSSFLNCSVSSQLGYGDVWASGFLLLFS